MTGSNTINATAVYGTQGIAASTNTPGARYGGVTVTDANGNLWLFGGGYGSATTNINALYNDLWKYNIASGEWAWVSGSNSAGGSLQKKSKSSKVPRSELDRHWIFELTQTAPTNNEPVKN